MSVWYWVWMFLRFNLKASVTRPESGVHISVTKVIFWGISNLSSFPANKNTKSVKAPEFSLPINLNTRLELSSAVSSAQLGIQIARNSKSYPSSLAAVLLLKCPSSPLRSDTLHSCRRCPNRISWPQPVSRNCVSKLHKPQSLCSELFSKHVQEFQLWSCAVWVSDHQEHWKNYLELFWVGYDETNCEHLAAVCVHADVVHQRRHLEDSLHFPERNILSSLQLDQILLSICKGEHTTWE